MICAERLERRRPRRAPRARVARAAACVGATPASTSMRAASITDSSLEVGRAACPSASRCDSMTSSALPTARPSGASIARDQRLGPDAGRVADRHQRLAPARRASSSGLHERAAAALDVEHQGVDALGDLLAHDRRRDERDALDGAGHVAQGVELAGRPARSRRSGRSARSRSCATAARNSSSDRPMRKPGIDFELVERAAGVPEAAAGHHRHDARRTPRPAARGSATSCRRRRRCCACRPGRRAGRRTVDARRRSGPSRRSAARSPRRSCRGARSPSAAPTPGSRAAARR